MHPDKSGIITPYQGQEKSEPISMSTLLFIVSNYNWLDFDWFLCNQDMCVLSQLEHGTVSQDYLNNVHPEVISRYYGVEGSPLWHHCGEMGAGHYDIDSNSQVLNDSNNSSSESTSSGTPTNTNSKLSASGVDSDNSVDADSDNLADTDSNNSDCSGLQDPLNHLLAGDQQQHICHPPIPVSDSGCPFASDNTYTAFCACLCKVCEKHIIPHHYGVSQQE